MKFKTHSLCLLLALAGVLSSQHESRAQGCVAVRCSAFGIGISDEFTYATAGEWQVQVAHRWFRSDRHFIGSEEQKHRQKEGSEVINDFHTIDLTGTYHVSDQFSLSLTFPFVSARRSSLYEHDRVNRHTMESGGLGDMRLVGNMWLLSPEKHPNGNIGIGLGIDAPTGDYKDTDYKYRPTGRVLDYVDNSIQPGDGGWGILFELQAFQKLRENTFAYANGTYSLTPEGKNSIDNSIWDSYIARAGLHYAIWPSQGLALSLGGRIEGVMPHDLVGPTEGRRRPGYSISIEPGITWIRNAFTINVTVPVALYNKRQPYKEDVVLPNGTVIQDSAFADFAILTSISYRF